MESFIGRSATEIARAVRIGEASARDVIAAHLDQSARREPSIHAFRAVRREQAIREAEAVDVRPDRYALPLAGVPVAVDDCIPVSGEPTTRGSLATRREVAVRDDEVVRRLRAAGAVVVGLSRVAELCLFPTTDDLEVVTRNPWNPDRSAGGPSGGAAAAVASGMVAAAVGCDGPLSVRIAAAACGVVGLSRGVGEHGVLARSVEDAELMLEVAGGHREGSFRVKLTDRLRVAVSRRPPVSGVRVDRSAGDALTRAARALVAAGHDAEIADPRYPSAALMGRWASAAADRAEGLDESVLQRRTRRHVALGRQTRAASRGGDGDAQVWQDEVDDLFSRYDVLLTPGLAGPPPPAVGWSDRSWFANVTAARFAPFDGAWAFAGVPAAAVPMGSRADGLPSSAQIVCGRGGDGLVLAVARQIEDALSAS